MSANSSQNVTFLLQKIQFTLENIEFQAVHRNNEFLTESNARSVLNELLNYSRRGLNDLYDLKNALGSCNVESISNIHRELKKLQGLAEEMGGYDDINGYGGEILHHTNAVYSELESLNSCNTESKDNKKAD